MPNIEATVSHLRVNLGPEWYKKVIEPVFADAESAVNWLTKPQPELHGRHPIHLVNAGDLGRAIVQEELQQARLSQPKQACL